MFVFGNETFDCLIVLFVEKTLCICVTNAPSSDVVYMRRTVKTSDGGCSSENITRIGIAIF